MNRKNVSSSNTDNQGLFFFNKTLSFVDYVFLTRGFKMVLRPNF